MAMEYNFKLFTEKGSKGNFISVQKRTVILSNAASSMLGKSISIYLDKENEAILLKDDATIVGSRKMKTYNQVNKIHCSLDMPLGRYHFLKKFDGGFLFKLKK